MPTELKLSDHSYHTALSVSETALAEIVGQTLATAEIEGGEHALVPVHDVLYRPLLRALLDANPNFDHAHFTAEVEAAEDSYLNAALGDKAGLRIAPDRESAVPV